MAFTQWMCILLLSELGQCYVNLSRKKGTVASQSSTRNRVLKASKAIDGNKVQTYGECSHTALGHNISWFQVDLGSDYSLKSVKIYYRNDTDWPPYRFRQFYLDVSNRSADSTTTLTSQRKRCYEDNTTAPATPPSVIDIPCKETARYVILETTYDATEDENLTKTGPVLEICEIDVYGCGVGKYGNSCAPCQGCSVCDIISGACPCDTCVNTTCTRSNGYCTEGCITGYWGNTCKSQCNQHCIGNTCEQGNGTCTTGCADFYYGYTCEHQCDSRCSPRTCDRVTGACSDCNAGYHGLFCNRACSPYCKSGTCDQHNGHCIGGCKTNWTGNICDKCDALHFGPNCSEDCSIYCKGRACNNTTGSCTDGCDTGYYKDTCNVTCNPDCKNGCNRTSGNCDNGCIDGKFGVACYNSCGPGCRSKKCERTTGNCTCKTGWQGERCMECDPKFYGASCEECSPHCYNGTCYVNNGSCIGGCTRNYTGDRCDQAPFKRSSESPEVPVAIIGAGVVGGLVVLIAVIMAVAMCRRRKNSNSSTPSLTNKTVKNKLNTNNTSVSIPIEDPEEEPHSENPEEAVYYNNLSVAKDIVVKDLLNTIRQKAANESAGFMKEFKLIPYGERFPCDTAKLEENKPKNRFKTISPYDHSRVELETGAGFESDYINANYIEDMDGARHYIACQGPIPATLVDHWRMIWQEGVQYIVMLTNLIEGPKVKCHQYWPSDGHELDVNPFSITLLEEKVYACYVVRKMTVHMKRVSGSRTVVQFHYTRWPDHGTPNPLNLLVFLRYFRHKINTPQHPILVHCSAGIGRTGTFIALDVLSRYGDVHHRVNVVEFVKAMRKDRMTMIQNADQYIFLYRALYEYFRRKGKSVSKKEFLTSYADLDKSEASNEMTDEFNALKSLRPQYGKDNFKTGQKYLKLNLTASVLPVEQYLVYLSSHVKGREPYYNAVSVPSFSHTEEFISAQYPVPGAAIDLIHLLVDQESPILISLNPLSDVKEIENWVDAENSIINLVHYEITRSTQTMLCGELRTTSITIKRKDSGETHTVKIFECLSWSSSEISPNEHATLTNLIKHLSLDRKSHPEGPITVVSKDGATCCGVFLAVYNAVEQILQDDEVDIFTIVQQLQCHRPEIISRREEYEFCFRSVWNYLSSDRMYANT
ncbi:receptor-type tyrosine-protein phosphatase epsilon-like isoform X1 [Ostrea edulis]|uniref:receptor-type tyrosine-protein phosphatase epsilon-like isoform X1 n=1 Tax=Ostrea edulis TaxID=37623 RepID=UPI0024AFF6E1|nr:receptor-type tyrosine-protein phosphatase epsilon-like isoform X1 [Ostrea edulis]